MNSTERRELRYARRKAKRNQKKRRKIEAADNFDAVFTYENLYNAYKKCRKGVSWKSSVQKYIVTAPIGIIQTFQRLQNGTYKSPGFYEFNVCERGKVRHIRSTVIGERVVQRCLCDNSLVPAFTRSFIYDNGASMANKGYSFAIRRLEQHLHEHYRKYGQSGYVLTFDFSKFFDNISHSIIKRELDRTFEDDRIKRICTHFVDAFGDIGLGLGSQVSQVLSLVSANRLDHYIKEVLRIRGYARYMDDGYLIHPSKEYLRECLAEIKRICGELGIKLNEKKTQIIKLSHGFTFLKARVFLTPSGKVVKKICKESITRERKKLKAIKRLLLQGKVTYLDAYNSWQSWRAHAKQFDAWHSTQSIRRLYDILFVFEEEKNVY